MSSCHGALSGDRGRCKAVTSLREGATGTSGHFSGAWSRHWRGSVAGSLPCERLKASILGGSGHSLSQQTGIHLSSKPASACHLWRRAKTSPDSLLRFCQRLTSNVGNFLPSYSSAHRKPLSHQVHLPPYYYPYIHTMLASQQLLPSA